VVTMGNLFGRKKESRVTEQDKAVLVSFFVLLNLDMGGA